MHIQDTVQNASGIALLGVLSIVQIAPNCAIGSLRAIPTHSNKNHSKTRNLTMQLFEITQVFDEMTMTLHNSENSQKIPDPYIRYKKGFY